MPPRVFLHHLCCLALDAKLCIHRAYVTQNVRTSNARVCWRYKCTCNCAIGSYAIGSYVDVRDVTLQNLISGSRADHRYRLHRQPNISMAPLHDIENPAADPLLPTQDEDDCTT